MRGRSLSTRGHQLSKVPRYQYPSHPPLVTFSIDVKTMSAIVGNRDYVEMLHSPMTCSDRSPTSAATASGVMLDLAMCPFPSNPTGVPHKSRQQSSVRSEITKCNPREISQCPIDASCVASVAKSCDGDIYSHGCLYSHHILMRSHRYFSPHTNYTIT